MKHSVFSSVNHCVWLNATSWTAAGQASLFITNTQSWLILMFIETVMPSNFLILRCPLLLQPSIFPNIRVFAKESVLGISWPKSWSFSFNISLYNEHSGLIFLRTDWLDLLAVQGTLKSLQYHGSKTSVLRRSAFLIVQHSHLQMTTGKNIALTSWTFVGPFSSSLQSFPTSGSFVKNQLFASGGQSIGASASASVFAMNIQDWSPLGLTDLVSLQSKGLSSLLQHHSSKALILQCSAFFIVQLSHPYMTTRLDCIY